MSKTVKGALVGAIIAGIFGLLIYILSKGDTTKIEFNKTESNISIVDIDFIDNNGDTLDIKLRNSGDKIAFIKSAIITVVDKIELVPFSIVQRNAIYVPINRHYPYKHENTTLTNSTEATSTKENKALDVISFKKNRLSLSQTVNPNNVDRFALVFERSSFGSWLDNSNNYYIYKIKIDFIYDEDNKMIPSKELIFGYSSHEDNDSKFPIYCTDELAEFNPEPQELNSSDNEIIIKNYNEILKIYDLPNIITDKVNYYIEHISNDYVNINN